MLHDEVQCKTAAEAYRQEMWAGPAALISAGNPEQVYLRRLAGMRVVDVPWQPGRQLSCVSVVLYVHVCEYVSCFVFFYLECHFSPYLSASISTYVSWKSECSPCVYVNFLYNFMFILWLIFVCMQVLHVCGTSHDHCYESDWNVSSLHTILMKLHACLLHSFCVLSVSCSYGWVVVLAAACGLNLLLLWAQVFVVVFLPFACYGTEVWMDHAIYNITALSIYRTTESRYAVWLKCNMGFT